MLFLMTIEAPLPMNNPFVCVSRLSFWQVWFDSFDPNLPKGIGTDFFGTRAISLIGRVCAYHRARSRSKLDGGQIKPQPQTLIASSPASCCCSRT